MFPKPVAPQASHGSTPPANARTSSSRPASGESSIMSSLNLSPSSRSSSAASTRRPAAAPSFLRSPFTPTQAPAAISQTLADTLSKYSPVSAPSPGGGGAGAFGRTAAKNVSSSSCLDFRMLAVEEGDEAHLLRPVQRGQDGTGGPRPHSKERYGTDLINEKMTLHHNTFTATRPKSAVSSSALSSASSPSSSSSSRPQVLSGWLNDFEVERKQFRSVFLHGEHVLMQLFNESDYSSALPPIQRQKLRTVVACSIIDSFMSSSERFGPLLMLVKQQLFSAVFVATEQPQEVDDAMNSIQSLLLHSSLGAQQKANIMMKIVDKVGGKTAGSAAVIRTHQEISEESHRKISALARDRETLLTRCSNLERDLAEAMNNDSTIRNQLQAVELGREDLRRERSQADADILALKAAFESQKLQMMEQQHALAAKASALQEQVTDLQKILDRSVPQAAFAAVTDGCAKWIALAQSSALYGKSVCKFVEHMKGEGERVRPPLVLKRNGSVSSSSTATAGKQKLPLADWSINLSEEGGKGSMMTPPFAPDVAADIVTIVKTLLAHKSTHIKTIDDTIASLRLSPVPLSLKHVTQLLQGCMRELLAQEYNDAYGHSVAAAVAAVSVTTPSPQHAEAVSFLANIVQMCLQRGRVLMNASASHAQDTITAALAAGTGAHAENPFVILAGDIDKQGESWGQLLQKLQQKNPGDIKDTLSESVLAVQLLQSRLTKLSANAATECAGVQVAVASACSKMMKTIQVISCTPFISAP